VQWPTGTMTDTDRDEPTRGQTLLRADHEDNESSAFTQTQENQKPHDVHPVPAFRAADDIHPAYSKVCSQLVAAEILIPPGTRAVF
jgi:hypothetical protein